MPSKKTPTKTLSKSDFIRAQSATMSAAEVIAKGKAQGIKIGSSLVYMVRGRTHKKARRTGASVPRPITTASSSAEDLLRAVAAELGLGKAIEILAGERARVRAVLRG
jgi:hypothetical protein